MKDLSQGVSTTLVAAFDPKLQGTSYIYHFFKPFLSQDHISQLLKPHIASPGAYLEDCQIGAAAKHAKSEEAAERLWDLSERLTHT